ncbi:MAG: S-methyl-5'-thioinosine phosphorylase [Gammaproteobacteria bacterium]|nr:S-methyl-5'-thioinosine phosphorylase [Gammaproteobacteria bacterium]
MTLGIIGGTGSQPLERIGRDWRPATDSARTPYGPASAIPEVASTESGEILLLPRHGRPPGFAPHLVNYRANMWLMKELGADAVVATYAVGAIAPNIHNAELLIPHQVIDYTWGRRHTYVEPGEIRHVDFTEPFDASIRSALISAGKGCDLTGRLHRSGVYGCVQGPRLESAAEIDRMERDGCAVVGMTAMPETALARELDIPYAGVCLVVNAAAGRGDGPITGTEIDAALKRAVLDLELLLGTFLSLDLKDLLEGTR